MGPRYGIRTRLQPAGAEGVRRSARLDRGAGARGRASYHRCRGRLGLRARHHRAKDVRQRRRPGAPVQEHQGLRAGRRRLVPPGVHRRHVELFARRHDPRSAQGRLGPRSGASDAPLHTTAYATRRSRHRQGQTEHSYRRRHRSQQDSGAALASRGRRALHQHVSGDGDHGPRHGRPQSRHLPRHDRPKGHLAGAAVAGPALGHPLPEMGRSRHEDAGRPTSMAGSLR